MVYVVYWVDLDDTCLKKSEVEIIGVYTDKRVAEAVTRSYDYRTGYARDERCHYCTYKEIEIDKVNNYSEDTQTWDDDDDEQYLASSIILGHKQLLNEQK